MEKQNVSFFCLEGDNREIGRKLAKLAGKERMVMPAPVFFTEEVFAEAVALYERYCPGLMEEVTAFAKEAEASVRDIAYTWMTYLTPHCSGLVLSKERMEDGHTRLFRNYEFSIPDEDFLVFETRPKGRYAHISGSIALFGREEGINSCGLAISMSSCGFPVSNLEGMRPPKIKGLQFWAVIRSLLENCATVEEALSMLEDMPIAYNINLYLADAKGEGVLFETMDGASCVERFTKEKNYLCGTNHIAISSFQPLEPFAMKNSVVRLRALEGFMKEKAVRSEDEVKELFLAAYPKGMSVNYYDEWFGTIKTVVLDTTDMSYQICWLGQKENGWERYDFTNKQTEQTITKQYQREKADPDFFSQVKL
ncbi:MAG: hypothetical protein PWP24_1219 [Clostridiales bacterium]|nr:hypothetical protein [Clostridiales bacterium]